MKFSQFLESTTVYKSHGIKQTAPDKFEICTPGYTGEKGPFPSLEEIKKHIDSIIHHKKLSDSLNESRDVFKDQHVIKLDPDRTDVWDVAREIMPVLVKLAYKEHIAERDKHNKQRHVADPRDADDEDDPEYEFTTEALVSLVDEYVSAMKKRLNDISDDDIRSYIEGVSHDFPEKLVQKK